MVVVILTHWISRRYPEQSPVLSQDDMVFSLRYSLAASYSLFFFFWLLWICYWTNPGGLGCEQMIYDGARRLQFCFGIQQVIICKTQNKIKQRGLGGLGPKWNA